MTVTERESFSLGKEFYQSGRECDRLISGGRQPVTTSTWPFKGNGCSGYTELGLYISWVQGWEKVAVSQFMQDCDMQHGVLIMAGVDLCRQGQGDSAL